MRFTLKEYQSDAVFDVLKNLRKASRSWHDDNDVSAFSLTATTGAGKTVMAAAVIEALFNGDDDYDFAADPRAVVLWITDDPSLNEQTRFRLLEASDLAHSRLKVIESSFHEERLEPGNVYFLNTQKLGRNSLLVRGAPSDSQALFPLSRAAPDLRAHTMWDVLRNTIEDEYCTLYLVLDEAHRGMKRRTASQKQEKDSIVRNLVNGTGGTGTPPIPIVWGISATVERFNTAMAAAQGRINFPNIEVDPRRVQESGLLKDDIRLEFPAKAGKFDTVLLKRAAERVRAASREWAEYAASQTPPVEPVLPLLVVQVPNKPSDTLLLTAFNTVRDAWPELKAEALAHVFGEHKTIELDGHVVPYVRPEKVQESHWIRVLFAKDAVSTGWDCPRAEVLMSFRPANDKTHITQLLGRMVRAPLARRIPGNDRLNSVECVLPHFDRDAATAVGEILLGQGEGNSETGDSGGGNGRRVLIDPVDMHVNPDIPEFVWEAFDSLPSHTLPRKAARPVKRLMALALALARDGFVTGARKIAQAEMCAVLDGLMARYKKQVDENVYSILEVAGETVVVGIKEPDSQYTVEQFTEVADDRTLDAYFNAAGRVLTKDIALRFAEHIADEEDEEDGFYEAHVNVAALARVENIAEELDREADKLARKWLTEYRVAVKGLSDERRAVYDDIIAMSTDPQRIDVKRPFIRSEETRDQDKKRLPTKGQHLMCDEKGAFPVGALNDWEMGVLEREMTRADFLAWYRNPGRAADDALAVAYRDGNNNWKRMFPDFIFFHGDEKGVKVSIVDPHSHHLSDTLPKLRGLSEFVACFGGELHRVEAVAKVGGKLRVLDLMDESVRQATETAADPVKLYGSDAATDF